MRLTNDYADDPWATAAKTYDVNTVYSKSTDDRGHYELVHVKLQPAILAEIDRIIALKKIPGYRTRQDFARDAMLHRAKHISDLINDNALAAVVNSEIVLATIEMNRQTRKNVETVLIEATRELADLFGLGKATESYVMMEQLEEMIEGWPAEDALRMAKIIDDARRRCSNAWDNRR